MFSPTPSIAGDTVSDPGSLKLNSAQSNGSAPSNGSAQSSGLAQSNGSAQSSGLAQSNGLAQCSGLAPSNGLAQRFPKKENLAEILIRFETAQTQIAELRFKNRKLEEIISGSGSHVKELEDSLKQYKTMKSYNEIIAEEEFQGGLFIFFSIFFLPI